MYPAADDLYSDPNRNKKLYPDFNWLDAVICTVVMQTHHLGFSFDQHSGG
jgi:hypothetical protein